MADNNNILDEENYDPDIITLEDEDGNELKLEVIDAADFNDTRYLAVVPYAETPEEVLEDDAYIAFLRTCEDENGDEYFEPVDDEEDAEELSYVSSMFAERLQDVYDIDPDDFK